MRVNFCFWTHPADLTELLRDILIEEQERSVCGELPTVAVVPVMKRKSFKELGDPTVHEADELGTSVKDLTPDELLGARAGQGEARRARGCGRDRSTAGGLPHGYACCCVGMKGRPYKNIIFLARQL